MEEAKITNIINNEVPSPQLLNGRSVLPALKFPEITLTYSDLTMKTSDKFKLVFRDKLGRIVDYFHNSKPL